MEHYEQDEYARHDGYDGYGRPKSTASTRSTMRCYEMRDRRTTR
jgi:hypothetical protein